PRFQSILAGAFDELSSHMNELRPGPVLSPEGNSNSLRPFRIGRHFRLTLTTMVFVLFAVATVSGLTSLAATPAASPPAPLHLLQSDNSHVIVELDIPAYIAQPQIVVGKKYLALSIDGF